VSIQTSPPPHELDRWNLDDLFPDLPAYEKAFSELESKLPIFQQWHGKLGASASDCADALEATDAFHRELGKLHTFAMLHADGDMRDGERQAIRQRVETLYSRFAAAISWMRPELLSLDDGVMESMITAEARLEPHRFQLIDLLRDKPHVLSEGEEKLLANAGQVTSSAGDVYQTLQNAEMPWPEIAGPDGEPMRLTPVEFQRHRTSTDRDFRQRLYKSYISTYAGFRETIGQTLNGAVKAHHFVSKARGHSGCLEAALHRNNVPVGVYDGLIDRVHEALPLMHRYQRLRAKALGLELLESHDLFCPLGGRPAHKWSIEEAQADVLASTQPLGTRYQERLQHAFENRWVDWHARDGKRIGAYSAGSAYDVHPYVLMNYTGEFDSVSTLAHEMGHAMHSDFSNRKQPFSTASYSIFVAEVASTVNEALLAAHLLERASDDEERLFLITHRIDSLRGTLFRQAMFAEFERDIHRLVERGEALTGQRASELYREILSRYNGWDQGAMKVWEEGVIEWAAIPHFYYNFYVYQYATGIVAAEALSHAMLTSEPNAADRYLNFLSSGGSAHPLELLRDAGVDLESDAPYRAAFDVLAGLLDQLDELLAGRNA
jgi:oligoendopeptidase F